MTPPRISHPSQVVWQTFQTPYHYQTCRVPVSYHEDGRWHRTRKILKIEVSPVARDGRWLWEVNYRITSHPHEVLHAPGLHQNWQTARAHAMANLRGAARELLSRLGIEGGEFPETT